MAIFFKQIGMNDVKYIYKVITPNGDEFIENEIKYNETNVINNTPVTSTYINHKFNPDKYYMKLHASGQGDPLTVKANLNNTNLTDYTLLFATYSGQGCDYIKTIGNMNGRDYTTLDVLLILITQLGGAGTAALQPVEYSSGTFYKKCNLIIPQEAVHSILSGKFDASLQNYYYIDLSTLQNEITYSTSSEIESLLESCCKVITEEFILNLHNELLKYKKIYYINRLTHISNMLTTFGLDKYLYTSVFYIKNNTVAPDLYEYLDYIVNSPIYCSYDTNDITDTLIELGFSNYIESYNVGSLLDKNHNTISDYASTINISNTPITLEIDFYNSMSRNGFGDFNKLWCYNYLPYNYTIDGYYSSPTNSHYDGNYGLYIYEDSESDKVHFIDNVTLNASDSIYQCLGTVSSWTGTIKLTITGTGGTLQDLLNSLEFWNEQTHLQIADSGNPSGKGILNAGYWQVTCFSTDTKIKMSDGTYKKIKDIKRGDKVLSSNGKPDKVIFTDIQRNKFLDKYTIYTFENKELKIIKDHRVYSVEDNCYKKLSQFKIGEHTLDDANNKIALINKQEIKKEIQHCTIFTKNYNSYYANGILCGNKFSNYKNPIKRKFLLGCLRILMFFRIYK